MNRESMPVTEEEKHKMSEVVKNYIYKSARSERYDDEKSEKELKEAIDIADRLYKQSNVNPQGNTRQNDSDVYAEPKA